MLAKYFTVIFIVVDFQDFHCSEVKKYLSSETNLENTFVLDFIRPQSRFDPDYHALKQLVSF